MIECSRCDGVGTVYVNYKYDRQCDKCSGTGMEPISREGLKDIIKQAILEAFKEMKDD